MFLLTNICFNSLRFRHLAKFKLVLFFILHKLLLKGYFVIHHPIVNTRNRVQVEFNLSGNNEEYIYLSSSCTHAKMKIGELDGLDFPE